MGFFSNVHSLPLSAKSCTHELIHANVLEKVDTIAKCLSDPEVFCCLQALAKWPCTRQLCCGGDIGGACRCTSAGGGRAGHCPCITLPHPTLWLRQIQDYPHLPRGHEVSAMLGVFLVKVDTLTFWTVLGKTSLVTPQITCSTIGSQSVTSWTLSCHDSTTCWFHMAQQPHSNSTDISKQSKKYGSVFCSSL